MIVKHVKIMKRQKEENPKFNYLIFHVSVIKKHFLKPLRTFKKTKLWNVKPTRILNHVIAVMNRVHARGPVVIV